MKRLMDVEPVMVTNAVAAVLALLVAFGAPITPEQQQAVLGVTAAIIAIYFGQAVVARNRVYSPRTMRRLIGEAEEANL